MGKRWTEKDLQRAEERIGGKEKFKLPKTIDVGPTLSGIGRQEFEVELQKEWFNDGDVLGANEKEGVVDSELALFSGVFLDADILKRMGFVPLPLRAMGAVRTTKNISVMPLEKLSGKNRNAKLRWLEYCEYKDDVRRWAKPASEVSGVDVVAWFKVTESWSKKDKAAKMWTRMEQKPDTDNIIKGVMDACMVKDEMVSLTFGVKWWSDMDVLWIRWRYK